MALGYDQLLMGLSKMLKGRGDVDLDARRGVSANEDDTAYQFATNRGKTLGTGRPKMTGAGEFLRAKGKDFGDLNAEELMAMFELDMGLAEDQTQSPAAQAAYAQGYQGSPELDKLRKILTPLLANKSEFLRRRYGNSVRPTGGDDIDEVPAYVGRTRSFE